MRKILVAVDGSDLCLRGIKLVLDLREQFKNPEGLEIHLLNVQPSLPSDVTRFVANEEVKSFHQDEAVKELEAARALLDRAGVRYEVHISVGEPADTICRFAKENGFDQIVMGTHGRSGVSGMLLGSVASKTLAESPVPVLVAK